MNLLQEHFDIAVETPDGIGKLRKLILTLAMQGKLVPQDPNDQPASELLKEIEAEKKRLVKEGKIKEQKQLPPIKEEEIPYVLPGNWEWIRISDSYYSIGAKNNQLQTKDYKQSGSFPIIDQGKTFIAGYSDDSEKILRVGAPVVIFGDHTKNIKYVDFDFIIGADGVKVLKPYTSILSKFFYFVIRSYVIPHRGYARHFGLLNENLLPVPPHAEQKRIVAKIDQLMSLCDKLEAQRNERDRKRLTVHASAVSGLLNAPDKPAFNRSWSFITRHFSELYSVTENVAELKKAILQLAVMGKLVQQDPNDQPASELLEDIESEKKRLVKEGKIKEQKPLPPIKEEDMPYRLPRGWEWVRLAHIGEVNPRNSFQDEKLAGFVPMTLISADYGVPPTFETRKWHEIKKGYTHFADGDAAVAKITPCFENGKACVFQGLPNGIGAGTTELHVFRNTFGRVFPPYLLSYLKNPMYVKRGISKMTGSAGQKRVPAEYFSLNPFPLPPLAEQKRIVAKIDQLMALCDKLDARLSSASAKRTAILDAVLARV